MAILATERVLTLDYWKFAYDLVEGDVVFDRHGQPATIKLIQQYRAQNCYEVQLIDGLTIAGDSNLKLPLENRKYRNRVREYKGKLQFRRPLSLTPISQLADAPLTKDRGRFEYSIPTAGALQLPHKDLPVPPFVFGYWFFNHHKDGKITTVPDTDEQVQEKFKDAGYKLTKSWNLPNGRESFIVNPSIKTHLLPIIPTSIPNNYLLASAEQRLELLSGIMYSKRSLYNQKLDRFRITSKNKLLMKQVQYLAESLGCRTKLEYREDYKEYTLLVKTKLKLLEYQTPKPLKVRQATRLITDVYEIKSQGCVHIETDSPDGSFLVGEGFIACH
jgi:replicative DNA helicase